MGEAGEGGEGGITGRVGGGGRRGGGEMLYFSASFCELVRLRVVVVVGGKGGLGGGVLHRFGCSNS